MKKLFTLLFAIPVLLSFYTMVGIDDVIAALKTGNAAQVAKYFDNTVDITLPQKSNSYSKSQAEMILRDFLNNNSVKNFTIKHRGTNAGSEYVIGSLVTAAGSFRTTIFMKQKGDKQFLQEMRFENE
jgi:hypothetical protein